MKKTRMPQRLLSLVLVLMMLISVLPVSAMAAELTPSDPETGLTATDVTNELTDSDRLAIFEENMDSGKVSRSEIPADDEMVKVIVQLDADSLLDVRNRTNASMSMLDFQQTDAAKAQLKDIANLQLSVMNTMESKGIPSSFTFSYTSVVSGFAAQVPYGKIHDIKNISGVEDVVLCQTYYTDSMGSATLGQALTAAEVAAYSNNTQYQGEGMLIGILDTGLDVNHEAFANAPAVQKLQKSSLSKLLYTLSEGEDGKTNVTAYSYAALWYAQKHSSSSLVLLTEDDLYKSGKVPFAFDYADADADVIPSADAVEKYGNDHGTHVAGITAGKTVDADGSVTFAGQSPEAQLAIFKVFSDSTNGASTDTILAALNDALLLDVDVINMSLGSNGGFGREAEGDLTTKYYDLVKSAGILLNCSAGNSYSSSQGGAKGDFTSVSDPDTGIISSSSSYDAALSVASVNANETAAFVTAQGRVPYQDVSGHDFTALLLGNDSSRTYEYVMVPNTGDTADYQGLDVTGKIAVVMRGGLSFEQKQLNAASAGAAGCIIYNNRDGYLLNMSVDNYKIPTVCISLANGQMMEAAQEKTLTVSKTEKGSVAMSDFSSWGPLPSLSLKPEITAPGGSIYSSLPFAQYGYMSGTSMASPYLAGVAAAALQYVNTLMPGASDTDKQLLVNRLLMSTADILYDENGVAYSPRKQGSGMVNLAEAVTTPAYLYVRGQDKTKIELGDDADQLGVYKLSFVVKNLTGSALSYDVSTTVQTESTTTDGLYIAQKGYVLSADTSAIKVSGGALSGSTVTVPANGETTVTVTVRLSDADRAYLAKFPNGIYVEGFVELTNNDDPALSVPFLGFYGDWTKAPIFEDADIYNGLDEKMYATNVAGVYAMMYVVKLGMYPFVVPEGYDTPSTSADKICVDLGGGNGVSNLYYLQAGLLRAAKTTNVTITDSDTGEVYLNSDGLNVRKAMYNSSSAAVRPGYVGEIFPPLTGIHLIPNNTRMTYTAAAYVDGFDVQDNLKNTYSFHFTSDGEMPYIVDRENLQFRTGDDGRKYLDVTLADNFCLAGATLYSTQWKTNVNNGKKEMSIGSNYYDGIIPALKADGTSPRAYEEYTYTFDVTDFYQKLLQGTFYVVAYDYAMNQCAYRVTLPENAVTRITLDQTAVTLPQKGYVQLNATVTPDDATDQNLVWSSSDSSVAEVKNGIVAAKAPGTATITVKSSVWPDVKAQCQITVTDEVGADVPMSEFLLNTSSVTMLAGTTYTNVRLYGYAPFYATDLNLEWTSSDESVVTVEPNGEGDQLTQYAKLTALKPGTATVTAKAKNGTASYDLAVTVTEASGAGSFNIVGDTLVSYSGTESTVTIPDGVRVIGENAFKNNDYILNVICPDSLEEIGYRAFYDCDNLQSVSLPETMKVINEGAFYYCKNLKTLGHTDDGVLPKDLTTMGVKAFYFCEALEGDLVIPEGVTSLSAGIFYNAYTLTSITIPDTVTSMDANGDQFANCTAVTSVTLSKNLTELPKTAFFTCKSLKHLPDLSNVTTVGTSCFAGCAALEEMVIPESLTFIGANAFARSSLTEITVLGDPTGLDSAFYNSLNLTTFVAPKLTTIGKQMFQGCTALVNFIVPDNVTFIGERAFQGCTNLKTLTFPASYKAETLSFGLTPFVSCKAFEGYVIEDGASIVRTEDGTLLAGGGKVLVSLPRDFKGTSYTVPDGVETISDYLFYKNTTITSVTLPASLKKIGTAAFQGCTKLTSIALPDGFTTLGEHAFDGCSGLKTVTFGQSLTAVPAYAFSNCSALTAVDLPATVETVGNYAFRGCAKATALSLKEGLTSIGSNAFYGWKALKAITIPQSVTSLGGSAFYDCNAAASIDCGSLTVIPERAFYNAKAVKTVKLSDNVTSIGERAFYNCMLLETINWPSQLQTIGKQAFYYARKLQNLDFSGTQLESIGNSAFYQPYEARTLAFPDTLQSIDSKAFAYLNYNKTAYVTEVNIPASVTSLAKDAFYLASGLKNIVVDANNPVYASSNGVVMLKDTGDIYIWPQGNETTEFTLPATMTEIPDKMFQNNTSLKKVVVPASVTKVGSYAFSSSKIEEIYFEDSANGLTVGTFAFYNCPNLTSLRLPYGLTSIGANAISKTGLETIVIPDTVTEMGGSALAYNDNLKNVTLSKSMTAVPSRGFVGCEALTELTLPASIQDCGVTDTSVAFNDCTSLQNIYVADGSLYFKSVDGVLFDKNGANLRYYPEGRTAESYRIPEGTIRVGGNAFAGNLFLKSVSYPTTLERIGTKAFFGCENLKDYYFNGMTAPLLETTVSLTGAYANVALYANFVGLWGTTGTGGFVYNDWGLNLYYPQGAVGSTGNYIEFAGTKMFYNDTSEAPIQPMTALAGEQRFVYVDAVGNPEDFAAAGDELKGAIAMCNRGSINFTAKGNNAVAAGAIGTVVVNNAAGTINMSTDGYTGTAPYVSLLMSDGQIIKANAEKKEANGVTYYVGKLTVGAKPGVNVQTADYYTMSDFSSWGIPGSLELKPEITAPGGNIYSLQNGGYQNMSGTSMASPQVAGMAAVVAQYIRANKLTEKTGLTARALAQSLLMSTAVPMYQDYGEGKYGYYSVMQQGAGLANVGAAVSAGTYIKMDKNANAGAADGKVKVELGDDPNRTGEYNFGFTIYNLKDAATSFNLSADFFTQDVFANQFEDGSVVNFEDTWTTDLTSNVTWTVDGQMVEMTAPEGLANCDFNGDGKVTKADGQALLDYVTGVLDSISNKDNADFDNDGNIDTYDAYLFFQQLNKSTVEIPANGSIHVEVNAKVLGLDEYDKASDNTGTYVEGYVYADEVASAEGVKGDSHSIPVLGYYGSWTDPSMFDIGSYLEYHEAKTESRVPYMYAYNKNATKYQALTVQYAGDSGMYYFGGNPYVDETYDPNRAAINPDTTVFARATFSLIRNAADSRATITGENGTVYYDKASGSPTAGAYYYSNGGSWRNAQGYIGINNAPTKAAEGEKITVKVTEAPEYYVTYDAEGNATTNWDALGDGASRTYTAFIDRTEPVLSNVYFKEDVETGTRSLVLTAQDNRYVAAAFLIDYDKMSILDRTAGSPEGAAEGAATDISLDLSKAEGVDHLYIQVADYADNTATYKINLNKEELSGPVSVTLDKQSIKMYKGGTAALNAEVSPFGVKPDGVTWKSSDETVATVNERGIITGVNKGTATITAASIKDPTATASCVVTVQTVDTTLVGALMDTNGDAQFYTWDMEHDTTWKKLVNFETTKSVSASTFDARTGDVYLQDGSFNINKMDLDTGKTLATYPGFEGEIPMWDMEYSLVYSTEAKPMLASVYYTYFLSPKPVDNLDLSAFDLGLYLWLFADASYFTAVTSLGANKIDTDKDGVKDTDTELFLALDDAGNIWTMNVYPTVDEKTGKDTWGASFGIIESNLANVGYAANPTDDGDLYDSLYATVEGQELVLYLANFTGDASHVYRILLNEDTGKWEAADIGNFGDGVWPATLVGTMYHANEDAAKAVNAAMSKTTVHTAQAVEMTPAQIQRYNGAETQAAKGSLNAAAPVAAVVNLPMGDAAENATASNVTVSADEKTVTVNVLAKDAATNGLFTVDYDAANLTLTNVAFNTQYSSYKDASGKVTLGYVDLNGVTAGSTVATLTFTVKDPTALDKINVTVTETERNDQTVNNAETLTADLHTETETVNAKAATCTEDGYTGDVVCKACGKVITKGEVIPALGHKIELVGAKEPTCTEDGYTGDEVCTICGEIVKKGEVIKATGHQYKDGKCTVCGAADPNYKPAVKTGDESNTALWVLVMASAAMLAAAVVVLPRKKHSR